MTRTKMTPTKIALAAAGMVLALGLSSAPSPAAANDFYHQGYRHYLYTAPLFFAPLYAMTQPMVRFHNRRGHHVRNLSRGHHVRNSNCYPVISHRYGYRGHRHHGGSARNKRIVCYDPHH